MTSRLDEDQWVAIQHKTFVNWANDQLSLSNRSVSSLATDLCDGVKLVALVEALQLQKVGRVFGQPSGRIQMIHNVGLALRAVQNDNVRLVNIGPDDIVSGNLKLVLGLLWHLILRYQISASKTRAPPKKLMLLWFQNAVPDLSISNFTSSWQDGIALHALLEYCKPGVAPSWKLLRPEDKVDNLRRAMTLAKDQLGIPRVITPEDFSSDSLDELSAMTYLSYFIKKNSPGYYGVLNWACRQLKTANISNLTTDWNDGLHLCGLVHSLGGEIPGYPRLDRADHQGNCQKALDAAEKLGVSPLMTASELSDPSIDHLAMMAYLSHLQRITPRKGKADKLTVDTRLEGSKYFVNQEINVPILQADVDVTEDKVKVEVLQTTMEPSSSASSTPFDLTWAQRTGTCRFTPGQPGIYKIQIHYDDVEITGSPFKFKVTYDYSKVKVTCHPETCTIGKDVEIKISTPFDCSLPRLTAVNENGGKKPEVLDVTKDKEDDRSFVSTFKPQSVGRWSLVASVDYETLTPVTLMTFDPSKAKLTGPDTVITGRLATCKVSTQGCGTNDVRITVEDSKGQEVTSKIRKSAGDEHDVSFTCVAEAAFYVVMASVADDVITGSPLTIEVVDPSLVFAFGDGLCQAAVGVEAFFKVNHGNLGGAVTATVDLAGYQLPVSREQLERGVYQFCFIPKTPGLYTVHVSWNDIPVKGSPFQSKVTDKSLVTLQDDLADLKDEVDRLALTCVDTTTLTFDIRHAGPGVLTAEMLTPDGKHAMEVRQENGNAVVSILAKHEGLHSIHLYWNQSPLSYNPISAFCPGPARPLDASKVTLQGRGLSRARTFVTTEFFIDGMEAGPGKPDVMLKGLQAEVATEFLPLKYDRYRCTYSCPHPGSYLLYVYWSEDLVPGCPYKVSVTPKGDINKVKVVGQGLHGGIVGHELVLQVDLSESGPGDITASCHTHHIPDVPCDVTEDENGHYGIRVFPMTSVKHYLSVQYDGDHVPGSPFHIGIGDAPDANQVKVFGPGVEHGLVDRFESRFIVDTHGAGTGQLAVKIRGPRGGFKVDMRRESEMERVVTCRYDPSECGEYAIHVRWSGVEVPNSPFSVQLVNTVERLNALLKTQGKHLYCMEHQWRAEI